MNPTEEFREYFQRYAAVSLGPDPEQLADFYDESFLTAGPRGGVTFKNDDAFLAWLRQVHDFNATTGMTALAVEDIEQIPVSADYALVTVKWSATFQKLGSEPIRFNISYLLRRTETGHRISAYVSHEDQEEAMRANGLL